MSAIPVSSVSLFLAVVLAAAPFIDARAHADEQTDSIEQIRAAARAYLDALNRGDLASISKAWTPNGAFVDAAGQSFVAQELAKREFSPTADELEPRAQWKHESTIRLVTPNSAIEQGTASPTSSADDSTAAIDFVAVWVKNDGRWQLDFLKEIEAAGPAKNSALDQLSWMVGEWESADSDIRAHLEVVWSRGHKYLIQKFSVQLPSQPTLRGEQRIAWDPAAKQMRCWLFRSDGGFAQGTWNREGDAWVVEKAGVTAEGEATSSMSLWAHDADDACWFKSLKAAVGEQQGTDIMLKFSRITAD